MSRYRIPDHTPLTAAQAKLVAAHVGWADRGARKHAYRWRRFVTEDDLRSAAYLGLIMAARKFDPARGLSFKTLAFTYCESLMRREVDTLRRLDGCVFDPTVEGGMRTIAQRTEWPMHPDGRPHDLATVPPSVLRQPDVTDQVRVAQSRVLERERKLVAMVVAGYSSDEIAATLKKSKRSVMARINLITRRLRRGATARVAA